MSSVEHDDEPKAEFELATVTADDAVDVTPDAAPAKARRGRRPKAQPETGSAAAPITDAGMPMMDAPPEEMKSVVDAEQPSDRRADGAADDGADAPPAKPRRGRARKPEPTLRSPTTQPEQRNDGPMAHLPADDRADAEAEAPATVGSAVRWNPATDTATFDWLAIEQVAAAEGPNQDMAKLLLAARAEGQIHAGASSYWHIPTCNWQIGSAQTNASMPVLIDFAGRRRSALWKVAEKSEPSRHSALLDHPVVVAIQSTTAFSAEKSSLV